MISTDRKIFVPNSSVAQRMVEYGSLLGELHIIVFTIASQKLEAGQIGKNVFLYHTNSGSRWSYVFDAIRIGKQILSQVYFGQTAITTQDPFETGFVGVMLKKFSKLPLQVQLHTDAWSPYFRYAGPLNWFRVTVLAPLVLKRADSVRVVSEKIKRDVIIHARLPARKIFVLPVFVDVYTYARSPIIIDLHKQYPQWETIILMASRLSKEKNILLAIKVFGRILVKHPKVGLVIVGQGKEFARLSGFVSRHHLKNNVVFEDWQNDLVSYYRTADIFINTSKYEGYGMSLIEAGASGCVVLTTKVGVGYDMLEDGRNAFVCPVGDEDCLSRKLVTLLENNNLRKTFGSELQKDVLSKAITKEQYLKQFRSHFDAFFETK